MMKKTTLALLISALLSGNMVYADEPQEPEEVLETIVVQESSFSQQIGTQKLTEREIAQMPTRNGNITELLKSNPNVRFSKSSNQGNTGGEIRPDEISFHGEKYYNNNFILDGMSNNDNLNPGASLSARNNDAAQAYGLPEGGTQSMWIDSSLLKSVEVFDSNVSAKFGNFTGGVINAELKDPDFNRWNTGRIYYRTTRSSWASLYAPEKKEDDFENAYGLDQQSRFTKHIYGFNVSQKINDKAAMLFSYNKTTSDIEFNHSQLRELDSLGRVINKNMKEPQRRVNESMIWRGVYLPDNGDLWRLTAIYAPHKSGLTRANMYRSGYTTTGGGIQVNLEWEKQFEHFKMKSYVGYKRTGDRVENLEQDKHNYLMGPINGYWVKNMQTGALVFGGYGEFETQKTIYTAKQDLNFNEFDLFNVAHKINAGWQFDYAKAKYERSTLSSDYNYALNRITYVIDDEHNLGFRQGNSISQNINCNGLAHCFDNQYAYMRLAYAPRNVSVNDSDLAFYVEDQMKWKQLEVVLGARLNYNSYLKNYNLAPRFSGTYDVFGDESTRIVFGANRYYAGSMLSYKLKQGIGSNEQFIRTVDANGMLQDWQKVRDRNSGYDYMSNKAKTPYSDERVLGLSQNILHHNLTFKWVNRKSHDGFSALKRSVNGKTYTTLGNRGESENDTFTLSFKPIKSYDFDWVKLSWSIDARRSVTKANNKDYNTSASQASERIIYNNSLLPSDELPPNDFNSPWGIGGSISTYFPKINLSWVQDFTFNQGRSYLEYENNTVNCATDTREACKDYDGDAREVKEAKIGSDFNIDWRFTYTQPIMKTQSITLSLDINNVLNRKSTSSSGGAGGSTGTYYKMGRNIWFGVSYNW